MSTPPTPDTARTPTVAPGATNRQIASGAAWLMLFKLIDKSVGIVSTLVLARLLVPADFGLVAMAMAVIAFTQLMGAFGFDSALIQRQDATREHYDTAWTFGIILSALMALTLVALAVPMAGFYNDARLVAILLVLAAGTFVEGFGNVGTVAFRKELDFRREFRFLLIKRLAAFGVTMVLAFTLQSYWALVAGSVAGRLLGVFISYRLHPFRPRLCLAKRTDLMHFSQWIFVSSLIQFLLTRSTDFILGRTVGSHGLGIYNVALEVAHLPATEIVAPVNRASFPAYARLASDRAQLRARFLDLFGVICLLGIPTCALMIALADPAVRVVLGAKWLEAIPLVKLFALGGLLGAVSSNLYVVMVAMGRPKANTLVAAGVLVISLPLTVWASLHHGVLGAVWAHTATAALAFLGILLVFRRNTRIGLRDLGRAALRPAAAALLTFGLTVAARDALAASWGAQALPLQLLGLVAGQLALYLLLLLALWRLAGRPDGPERLVGRFAHERWVAWRRPLLA